MIRDLTEFVWSLSFAFELMLATAGTITLLWRVYEVSWRATNRAE